MKAAVTLNPHTPISLLEDILQDLDMVLLMSVNPGYGGQKFIEHSIDKTARLKDMILAKGLNTLIEVDGGNLCLRWGRTCWLPVVLFSVPLIR